LNFERYESIGIKQTIRFEWMLKTVNLLLAGLDSKSIRMELHEYLREKRGDGSIGERGETSRSQVVNMLMKIWVSPDQDLLTFRDSCLSYLSEKTDQPLAVHWAMVAAVYPFWFNVAQTTGRLLGLQDQATQSQVVGRLKEQYGDRQTVARYGRHTLRSFVTWGVLKDSVNKGSYEKTSLISIKDSQPTILLLESSIRASKESKIPLKILLSSPSLFPFSLPSVPVEHISQFNERLEVVRYGLDDTIVQII